MRTTAALLLLAAAPLLAAERAVDPTFLYRSVESATVAPSDETPSAPGSGDHWGPLGEVGGARLGLGALGGSARPGGRPAEGPGPERERRGCPEEPIDQHS